MECNVSDYVIGKVGTKFVLLRVKKRDNGHIICATCDSTESKEIKVVDIVANLGTEPEYGKVFGCDVEPFVRTVERMFGVVHFFIRMHPKDTKDLLNSLVKATKMLRVAKLKHILPIDVHVRPKKGNISAQIIVQDDEPVLILRPKTTDNLLEIVLHEVGHLVYRTLLPESMRAVWVNTYHDLVDLNLIHVEDVRSVLSRMEEETTIKRFSKKLDVKDRALLTVGIRYMAKNAGLQESHLTLLFDQGYSLQHMWPTLDTQIVSLKPTLTDKAAKGPEYLFAEVLRLHLMGTMLPKDMKKLIVKSVGLCGE